MSSEPTSAFARPDSNVAITDCPSPELLVAYCDGTLDLGQLSQIHLHINSCSHCERELLLLLGSAGEHHDQPTPRRGGSETPAKPVGQVVDSANSPLGEALVDSSRAERRGAKKQGVEPTAPMRLGPYRLGRKIGHGGMGMVYMGWHERLNNRPMAIKFLPSMQHANPVDRERLRREIDAVATLRHENVVYASDAGESEGIDYLVMEYVDGIDLSRLVAQHGPLPVADACELIRQAAIGLQHVHEQNLVHRDVKPSNLILAKDGKVKILDLGLARVGREDELSDEAELTNRSYLLGTADYLAPEQAADAHTVDIRADLYSLGCTLFKLLTGQAPFGGDGQESIAKKMLAHASLPAPELASFRRDIPPELQQLMNRLLAKSPQDRPALPSEVSAVLARLAVGADLTRYGSRNIVATPAPNVTATVAGIAPSKSQATPAWWKKLGIVPTLIAAVAILGVGSLVFYGANAVFRDKEPSRPSFASQELFTKVPVGRPMTLDIIPETGTIRIQSKDPGLVRLGVLPPRTGKFAVSIDNSKLNWMGNCGLFLGLSEVFDKEGNSNFVAQFITLGWGMPVDKEGKQIPSGQMIMIQRHYSQLVRSGSQIVLEPIPNVSVDCPFVFVPAPAANGKFRMELEFQEGLLQLVKVNDNPLPELTTGSFHAKMGPRETQGPLGIWQQGINSTSFFDFDFTVLNKE